MLTALQGMTAATGKKPNELLTKLSGLFQMKSTNSFSNWAESRTEADKLKTILRYKVI